MTFQNMVVKFSSSKESHENTSILGKRKLYETFEKNYNVKKLYGQDIHTDLFNTNIGFNTNIDNGIDIRDTWRY
jgi:hypothetical protein